MPILSVNINKIATLRNSRGGNLPNLLQVAKNIQKFGAQGITIHPRPDERHIRYADAKDLKNIVTTEYNIEGNPSFQKFIHLVTEIKPTQVTLVPDDINAVTSSNGWNTITNASFLTEIINHFKSQGIRTSIFIENNPKMIEGAKKVGADRVELYTEAYAKNHAKGFKNEAIAPYVTSAQLCQEIGLGVNAGHDLNLENINFFKKSIPNLLEVSIGHALISEALYLGFQKVIQQYLSKLA